MHRLVFISAYAALAIALGLAFVAIPNFELVSTTFFLSGYFLGIRDGAISATLGELVFSLLNPLGAATPPLLIAQILSMIFFAISGSFVAKNNLIYLSEREVRNQKFRLIIGFYLGTIGLILTLIFDVLTTISFLIFSGLSFIKFIASLLSGIYFSLIHIGMNTLIFAILLPILIPLLQNRFSKKVNK